MLPGRY